MFTTLGNKVINLFQKYMPDAYVFAILLTIITSVCALIWINSNPLEIITAWYKGFWNLLEFGMQIVLIMITGFSIALSPIVKKWIDKLAGYINTPSQVYFFVVFIGVILTMISFGWVVITCVLARELALRVNGINYPFLIALVYFSSNSWVTGFSSTIPLLLSTDNNYLIEAGVLTSTIPTGYTLGSYLNFAMMFLYLVIGPIIILLLAPKNKPELELSKLMTNKKSSEEISIEDEASKLNLDFKSVSDKLNNSVSLHIFIVTMGLVYIIYHFSTNGFNLNFNIMIFIFLMIGIALHKTPMRYAISMKRASGNISGILFQYPFYAGIMGIMLHTGLGERLAELLASVATIDTYSFYAYITGGFVNFAIPSAGGEFAVVGPSIINAVKEIGAGLPSAEITEMISRASLSIAYGESLSNLLQPFFLLTVFPVMGIGVNLQARDILGYLAVPFLIFFVVQIVLVMFIPM